MVYTAYMLTSPRRSVAFVSFVVVIAASAGCGSSGAGAGMPAAGDAGDAAQPALPTSFAVTADWLDHRLSLVDFGALVGGSKKRQDVVVGQVDLSRYTQGPLSLRITPDGKTALVSVSSGFFVAPGASLLVGGATIPTGPTRLAFVDLESRKVLSDLDTGDGPTGIAITHDGARAFVCHVGASTITVIDVKARTILQQVDIGGSYAEEVSLDDSGTVGIFTYIPAGGTEKSARTFAVADMAATLSAPIALGSDAAGVPFFPGTKTAYVVLSYNPLTSPTSGYALIDATDPHAPVKLATAAFTDTTYVDYQAIPAPGRGTVLVPVAAGGKLALREYRLAPGDVDGGGTDGGVGVDGGTPGLVLENTFDVASTNLFGAFGLVLDAQGHVVLTMPGEHQLAVLDMNTRSVFTVPWTSQAGPTGIDRH